MSGRVLSFKQYLGGADNVLMSEVTPSMQKTYQYDYPSNTSTYTFNVESQTVIVDTLTYDRTTGEPNFTDSTVVGVFANTTVDVATYVSYQNNAEGIVNVTIPANLYTGPIEPDARANVPINVVTVRWSDSSQSPPLIEQHRHAQIQRYEPGVTVGNPRLSNVYLPIGVGAISTFTGAGAANVARADANFVGTTYTVSGTTTGPSATTGQAGTGATFHALIKDDGAVELDILSRGIDYVVGDTINILDSDLGGAGGPDITVTVTATG